MPSRQGFGSRISLSYTRLAPFHTFLRPFVSSSECCSIKISYRENNNKHDLTNRA